MVLLFRLLSLSPKFARAFRDFAIGLSAWSHTDLDAIKKWFESTPQQQQQQMLQQQPALNEELEAMFVVYRQHMDTQYEVIALRQQMLTLPALPEESY
jgi:hypothetical protein